MILSSIYIIAGRASNAFFLFLLNFVVSRTLGPSDFGIFSFLATVVISANCFASLGFDIWMVREVTKTPDKAKYYLSNILGLKIAISLIVTSFILFIFQMAGMTHSILNLLYIISISILFNSISQTLWHYGDCFKKFYLHSSLWASSNIIKSLLGVSLVLLFRDLEPLIWGVVIAEAISLILSFRVIRHQFGLTFPEFRFVVWKDFLIRSSPMGVGMIFSVLYFRLDIIMLQFLTDEIIVGIYSASYKLFEMAVIFPHSLMLVMFPALVEDFHADRPRFKERFKKALVVYSLIGGSVAFMLWGFSSEVINIIFGDKFRLSAGVLDVLAWAILIFFINYLLANILIASGREKTNSWNLVGATVLNILLNQIWIPKYGAMGAAWATLCCEVMLIAVLSFQALKILK